MSYESDRSGKSDTFPRRKIEKLNSEKDKSFDVEQLQNAIRALTNVVVGLKKTNSEASSSRGYFKNQFRQNLNTNNKNTPPDIAANEDIFNTIWVVLSLSEAPSSQEINENEEEEETENDEELEEPQQVNVHFWDSLIKKRESKNPPTGQHAYNTRSRAFTNTRGASSSSTTNNDNNNSQPNKQTQSGK